MGVNSFSKDIVIVLATFNRKKVTEICLKNLSQTCKYATLWVIDDYSTEYDLDFLKQIAPNANVFRLEKKYGIEHLRRHSHFLAEKAGFKFIYHTDNDAFHDPNWLEKLFEIHQKGFNWIGLYNTAHHNHRTKRKFDEEIDIRSACPGISFFYKIDLLSGVIPDFLPNSWDFVFGDILFECAVSTTSYLEHFGANGLHNTNFDGDRAKNPTKWLSDRREEILNKLMGN